MPLEPRDWDDVEQLVLEDLVGTDNPFQTLKTYFPDDVGRWKISNVATDNAATVVAEARKSPLTDPDPLPLRLLEVLTRLPTIRAAKPDDLAMLEGFLRRLREEKAALDKHDPYEAHVLPGSGQVFINRRRVRESLRRMVAPEPGRPEPVVLRVTGERDVGKSYTYELIRHLATQCGFSHARVILDRSSTARDILDHLHIQVASDATPPDADDALKRLRYWALWVASLIQPGRDRPWWWLVFDECDDLDPGSDAVEFIAQLSIAVAEMSVDAAYKRPRLVLLGYGDDLDLPLPRKQIVPDAVVPAGEADLREFFTAFFREILEKQVREVDDGRRTAHVEVDEGRLAEHVEIALRKVIEEARAAEQQGGCYMRTVSDVTEGVVDVYTG